jgi:thiamine-monophosphate kinase
VTGELGGSLRGKHFRFTPRLAEGAWLAAQSAVRAMMDVSDGLAKDLRALTPRGAAPALDGEAIPIAAAARQLARESGRTPLAHALGDGEDYELAFVVDADADRAEFARRWRRQFPRTRLSCAGRFVAAGKLPTGAVDLRAHHGYEHLR